MQAHTEVKLVATLNEWRAIRKVLEDFEVEDSGNAHIANFLEFLRELGDA